MAEPKLKMNDLKPWQFDSAKEMYMYLRDVGDLYSKKENIYVFYYSESGALATYEINEGKAKELSKKSKEVDEYWGAFLGPGGRIYDVPDDYCESNYAMKFCEDWYKAEWYDTRDYADFILGNEDNLRIADQRT